MKIKNDYECAKCRKYICMETIYSEPGESIPKIKRCPKIANEAPEWELVKRTEVK